MRAVDVREELLARGLSPRTVKLYQDELWRLERWCEPRGWTLKNVPAGALRDFLATRPASWSTRHLIHGALVHYWAIVRRARPPLWAVPVPRKPTMRCRALEPAEASRLAAAAVARGDDCGLMVSLGLFQALRREEIATLRWDDFTGDGWLVVRGKAMTRESIPVHPTIAQLLDAWPVATAWVFPSPHVRRDHVTPATVWHKVKLVGATVGLDALAPHVLRHTCLAEANDRTGDLRAVQAFARHSRPDTTSGYTRATARRLRAVIAALDYTQEAS